MRSSRKQTVCTIYIVKSPGTPKVYIGQTWYTIKTRISTHKRNARKGTGKSYKLYNSMRKYGIDTFKIEALAICDTQEKADELEDFYILQYNSIDKGLNLKRGGAAGGFSDEARAKMSASKMGTKNNRYGITGPDHPMYGKHHTDEAKKKISEASKQQIRQPITEQEKERLTAMSHATAKLDEQKVREIKALLKSGSSLSSIAKTYGVSDRNIAHIRNGFTWSWVKID